MSDAVPLRGSMFHALDRPRRGHPRTRQLTAHEEQTPIELTVLLREWPFAPSVQQTLAWMQSEPHQRDRFDADAVAARHAFAEEDRDLVVRWARQHGAQLVGEDPVTRRIRLRAPAAKAAELFGVRLEQFRWERPGGVVEYRGHLGPVYVPRAIAHAVDGVYGLDDRPIARPRLMNLDQTKPGIVSYDPTEIASLYRYPRLPNDGAGLHLVAGMIELGGVTHDHEIAASFARLNLPAPEIVHVRVDGAEPSPDAGGADLEIALDYQVLGAMTMAMAPQARLTIVSYDAPNSERGFIDAAAAAASDTTHRPAAVSISWGAAEEMWSHQGMRGFDSVVATGALHGVTYSAAAGDSGSADGHLDGRQHAEFPASSPHVWACGGTTLLAGRDGILSETVWNERVRDQGAAGSGVSGLFPGPAYQTTAGIHARQADTGRLGRGLPDGCGVADPVTGWNVFAGGRLRTTGGTSAVAPMYTALWTLVGALRGRPVGLPHPALYRAGTTAFNDITQGNTDGPYSARRGWDAASGWGSPIGVAIARALGAPVPQVRSVTPRRRHSGDLAL
ncbi:MAG: peptidase S53 [Candidatus Dormibacteraeota bacterium]|nr:peptidase S53 [Candidatus Dormibacteraeota bacterium]